MRGGEYFNWIDALPVSIRDELMQGAQDVSFAQGAMVYERMEPAQGVFRITQGRVRLFLMRDTGSVLLLKICEAGETIGDLASIDGQPFPLFAEAMTAVKTKFIKASHLNVLRSRHPQINAALLPQIASSARGAISLLEHVTMHSVEKQVAGRLQWLKRSRKIGRGASSAVMISQSDLGLMIGASRQSVNKALSKLEKRGLITKTYGHITINDDDALDAFLTQ